VAPLSSAGAFSGIRDPARLYKSICVTEHNQAANIVLTTRTDSYKEILPALAAYLARILKLGGKASCLLVSFVSSCSAGCICREAHFQPGCTRFPSLESAQLSDGSYAQRNSATGRQLDRG